MLLPKYIYIFTSQVSVCRSGYEVVTMSWYCWWYAVVMKLFFITCSCMKVGIRRCPIVYAVACLTITWVCSCMVISQVNTVNMVTSVQLHIFLCNCISWCCDNIVPAPTPEVWITTFTLENSESCIKIEWFICLYSEFSNPCGKMFTDWKPNYNLNSISTGT